MACAICGKRKPRRICPGVGGEICALCCGTERETTVACPLDCEYLAEARRHERPAQAPEAPPDADIEVSQRQLADHEALLNRMGSALAASALRSGAADADVREALAALVRSQRTLANGIYYETRPAGPVAGAIYRDLQEAAQGFRAEEQRQSGVTHTRDADVLAVAVFLRRAAAGHDNGRPRGRAFIGSLREFYAGSAPGEAPSSLILP